MGTSAFAVASLETMIRTEEDVVCVVTQPDRPKGRGREVRMSPVKEIALRHGLPLYQRTSIKGEEGIKHLQGLSPDLFVIVAFGQILSREILAVPLDGSINLHASLLPKYRGAAPINWALINGEEVTGVTTMYLEEGMDTGPILPQRMVDIDPVDTAAFLHNRLAVLGAELLHETIEKLKRSELKPVPQDHGKATYAPRLRKEDGAINWRKGARENHNLIRGLFPWPSAYSRLSGKMLKIFDTTVVDEEVRGAPGEICEVSREGIKVITGKGVLMLRELQLQDRKRMRVSEFIQGYTIVPGTILD